MDKYEIPIASSPPPELEEAVTVYRKFLASIPTLKDWCFVDANGEEFTGSQVKFDGELVDLAFLSYCEYELGHPQSGSSSDGQDNLLYASLIWAQAIINNTEMQWRRPISGQIAIGGPDTDYPRLLFFPHAHIMELNVSSGTPQYDLFEVMTDILLLQAVNAGYTMEQLPKLHDLCFSQEYGNYDEIGSTFNTIAIEARLLRAQRSKHQNT